MKRNQKEKVSKPLALWKKILLNIIFVFAACYLVRLCYVNFPGYAFVYDSILRHHLDIAKVNKHATVEQRTEAKLGFDYKYLKFIKDNTPENAVIWMPGTRDDYYPPGVESSFQGEIYNKMFRLRILYPRKIVDNGDTTNKYADKITHIAIVYGKGYEMLPYEVEEKNDFAVFPLIIN